MGECSRPFCSSQHTDGRAALTPAWSDLSCTVMYCTDPGEVDHSTRLISDPVLLVGTTIQYTCNPGFVLEGSSLLTCYSRETGSPIWTSRLPHCVCESPALTGAPGGLRREGWLPFPTGRGLGCEEAAPTVGSIYYDYDL